METWSSQKKIECNIQSIKSTKRIFAKGDVLFGKLRPALNKVAYANCDGICSTDIIVLRAKDKNIMPEFYSILLRNADFNAMVLNGFTDAWTSSFASGFQRCY